MKINAPFISLLLSLIATSAHADCLGWPSGNVSKFSESYISFWGVPIKAKTISSSKSRLGFGQNISYTFYILEDYGQFSAPQIQVISPKDSQGYYAVEPTLNQPQFISVVETTNGDFVTSRCTDELPYVPLKSFLETGEDTYIPNYLSCLKDAANSSELNLEKEGCKLWENNSYHYTSRQGDEDLLHYIKKWRAKQFKFNQ